MVQRISGAGFQVACIFVGISCLFFTMVSSRPNKLQNKIFVWILVDILVAAVCDAEVFLVSPLKEGSQMVRSLQAVSQYVYFVVHTFLSLLFCFYIALVTGACYRLKRKRRFLYEFPMILTELLVLLNPVAERERC